MNRKHSVTGYPVVIRRLFVLIALIFLLPLISMVATADSWSPAEVDVWDPPFNKTLQREKKTYQALDQASRRWRIRVFIPHLKDAYWLGVNYGLIDTARSLGISLTIYQAGGYDQLPVQRGQIQEQLKQKSDGVIISAISENGLNDLVEQFRRKGIPVLDLINGISSPHIAARVAGSYWDTGYLAGSYLRELQKKTGRPAKVGWFPGPDGAGWVTAGDVGFRDAIRGSDIQILVSKKGDTGSAVQKKLVTAALDQYPEQFDYIIGTTVTAEVAVGIIRKLGLRKRTRVLSYYYGPGVHRGIRRGDIIAAPSDHQVLQARMAVDTLVRVIEKKRYYKHVAPSVTVIDRSNIRKWDSSTTLAPRGFRPVFSINE